MRLQSPLMPCCSSPAECAAARGAITLLILKTSPAHIVYYRIWKIRMDKSPSTTSAGLVQQRQEQAIPDRSL